MENLDKLVNYFSRLPGIGKKSAGRIAYHLLETGDDFNRGFGQTLIQLKENISYCDQCGNYTDINPCPLCTDPKREKTTICVVESPKDVMSIDSSGEYRGIFFVMRGVLSPLDGIGPEELGLTKLISRVDNEGIKEIIIATNPTVEGDSTALYIQQLFKDRPVEVSRIASGIPVGGDMEYADRQSIARAFRARRRLEEY